MLEHIWEELSKNAVFSGGFGLMAIGAAVAYFRTLPKQAWAWLVSRIVCSVEIKDTDLAYDWVCQWLAEQPRSRRLRYLRATTHYEVDPDAETCGPQRRYGTFEVVDPALDVNPRPKVRLEPGLSRHRYWWRGKLLYVVRAQATAPAVAPMVVSGHGADTGFARETVSLHLWFGTADDFQELFRRAWQASHVCSDRTPIHVMRWQDWTHLGSRPRRRPESLILPGGTFERVMADIRRFQASEAWYSERGIPYRRGYLFEGPPGTGKTSLVTVIASELNYGIATLSLSNVGSDETFRQMVARVPPRTLLIIEDIDCAVTRRRDVPVAEPAAPGGGPGALQLNTSGLTLSGFLNAIDGVMERHGQLLFMTTNHAERLDSAVVRPGRVDYRVFLGRATSDQAGRLFRQFYGDVPDGLVGQFAAAVPDDAYSMAELQGFMFLFRDEPARAVASVPRLKALLGDTSKLEEEEDTEVLDFAAA